MTSELFVYVTLPGQTVPVTAARFELEGGVGRLVYGKSYLGRTDAVAIDPLELQLAERRYETAAMGGMFGALRDASPDSWGRRIIEKRSGKAMLGELDYLLESPDDRVGALSFGLSGTPPAPLRKFNRTLDLARVQRVADALEAEASTPSDSAVAQVEDLVNAGTSMGGARPKTVVEDDDALWIAKLNRQDDKWNNARVEHAMLRLGRACGVETAESRLVKVAGSDALLVKRFDRTKTEGGYERARMVSALTLLRCDEKERERWSYPTLVEELRRASSTARRDAHELFRRMCFNALISNTDDHPRNHAVIAWREWRLSPAYDLTPTPAVSTERRDLAMTIGDAGRWANAANLRSQAARFLLTPEEADQTIDAMERVVLREWRPIARSAGVSEADCERIAPAFGYAGFRYPLTEASV